MHRLSRTGLAALRRRIAREDAGMTLPEMMVGILAGMVVIMGAYTMLDGALKMQTRTSDRIDGVQRGRNAMEKITRDIRSQQCLDSQTSAMQWAADLGMQFYASVAAERAGSQPVERRRLEWVEKSNFADGKTTKVGDIVETVWRSKELTPPYSFPAQPTSRDIIAQDVESDPNVPMFRYYGYEPGKVGRPSSTPFPMVAQAKTTINTLGYGVAATNLSRIVLIDIRYNARARRGNMAKSVPVPFANRVSVRTADPSDPLRSPLCL